MWNRGGEGVALLMMIMHSLSTTFLKFFADFFGAYPKGTCFTASGTPPPTTVYRWLGVGAGVLDSPK